MEKRWKTLRGVVGAIQFLGWLVVVLGVIQLIIGIAFATEDGMDAMAGMIGAFLAAPTIAFGLILVAFSQLIQVQVSIEENTRAREACNGTPSVDSTSTNDSAVEPEENLADPGEGAFGHCIDCVHTKREDSLFDSFSCALAGHERKIRDTRSDGCNRFVKRT